MNKVFKKNLLLLVGLNIWLSIPLECNVQSKLSNYDMEEPSYPSSNEKNLTPEKAVKRKKKRKKATNPYAKFLKPIDLSTIKYLKEQKEKNNRIKFEDLIGIKKSEKEESYIKKLLQLASYLYLQAEYCNIISIETDAYEKRQCFAARIHSETERHSPELKGKKISYNDDRVFFGNMAPKTNEGTVVFLFGGLAKKMSLNNEDKLLINRMQKSLHEEIKLLGNIYFWKLEHQKHDALFTKNRERSASKYQDLLIKDNENVIFFNIPFKELKPLVAYLYSLYEIMLAFSDKAKKQNSSGDWDEGTVTNNDKRFNNAQVVVAKQYKEQKDFLDWLYAEIIKEVRVVLNLRCKRDKRHLGKGMDNSSSKCDKFQ